MLWPDLLFMENADPESVNIKIKQKTDVSTGSFIPLLLKTLFLICY